MNCLVNNVQFKIDSSIPLLALKLTSHQDYVSLTRCFLSCLHKVQDVKKVHVYEIYGRNNSRADHSQTKKPFASKLILKEVINILNKPFPIEEGIKNYPKYSRLNEACSTRIQDGLLQTTFPINNDSAIERILVIESEPLPEKDWQTILFAVNIYGNLLAIIDEKDRDRLTGLLNRYTFEHQVSKIVEFSQQQTSIDRGECKKTSWLAILDIDFFKKVNDKFGHLTGDDVLIQFSTLMKQSFRYTDILFRYGGEEFVVILNGCSEDGALKGLERLRQTVESFFFPKVGKITVSIGFIQLYADNAPAALIEEADRTLYHAKKSGRNRIVSYLDLLEETGERGEVLLPDESAV